MTDDGSPRRIRRPLSGPAWSYAARSVALDFNGTVVVEWLNVSGGGDGSPDWFFLHRHLMREGVAWVGVSAQKAGIDGGGVL